MFAKKNNLLKDKTSNEIEAILQKCNLASINPGFEERMAKFYAKVESGDFSESSLIEAGSN